MSNIKGNAAEDRRLMDDLQDKLDFAVFEQEEMDPKKVREILAKMESTDTETDLIKAEFDKSLMWEKLNELCDEEMAEERAVSLEEVSVAASGKKRRVKRTVSVGKSATVRKIALSAATIIIALFVGANIGTYATEKKGVIELVKELNNGTSFRVTGDAPSMDVEKDKEVYYSWNDVPNEYKEFLVIPQGLPKDMKLYDIKITSKETHDEIVTRYLDDNLKYDFTIQITVYENNEFSFANSLYEYDYSEQKIIGDLCLNYYFCGENEVIAQFIEEKCVYTFSGTLGMEKMQEIIEATIEKNL